MQLYVIDANAEFLPSSLTVKGLDRPIHLRRTHYHSILSQIQEEYNATWSNTTVLGDIFELDLSLPLSMGSRVGLMKNPFSPEYEVEYLQNHALGAVHNTLDEALQWIITRA